MIKNTIENTWFRDQNINKRKIIFLALQLIEQGTELIKLATNENFIDYSFRAEKLNQVLQAFKEKGALNG